MSFVTHEVTVYGAQYIALYSDSNHDNHCLFEHGFDTVYQICLVFLLVCFWFLYILLRYQSASGCFSKMHIIGVYPWIT